MKRILWLMAVTALMLAPVGALASGGNMPAGKAEKLHMGKTGNMPMGSSLSQSSSRR